MTSGIKLKFGPIEHGWVNIILSASGRELKIDASDVPIDPITELIKAVEGACLYKSSSEAWLSIEPNYYQMVFEPMGENIKISIFYVDELGAHTTGNSRRQRKTKELEYVGSTREVLVHFWRGFKELASREQGYKREIEVIEHAVNKI